MEQSQRGIIVLFLYPTPNSRTLPSRLNKKMGLIKNNTIKIMQNKIIEERTMLCRIICFIFIVICYIIEIIFLLEKMEK